MSPLAFRAASALTRLLHRLPACGLCGDVATREAYNNCGLRCEKCAPTCPLLECAQDVRDAKAVIKEADERPSVRAMPVEEKGRAR